MDVEVRGSGFVSGSTARWLLNGQPDQRVKTNSTVVVSSSSLIANITIAPDAVPSLYDIEVATPAGKKGIGTEAFTVLPMEELPSVGSGTARDVNSAGVIAGTRGGTCDSGPLPVVWDASHQMIDLPLPSGFCNAWPEFIDESGVVVGTARSDLVRTVLRWIPGPNGYSVETALAFTTSTVDVIGINRYGHIVGSYAGNGGHAFWWSAETGLVDLPIAPDGRNCAAWGVNDLDQIVGSCTLSGSIAMFWESPYAAPVVLPRLPGYDMGYRGQVVNNVGDIAGYASVSYKGRCCTHAAVRWVRNGQSWIPENLGSIGSNPDPIPSAMNDDGWIVGADLSSGNTRHAFLWRPGFGMKDLGSSGGESYAWGLSNDGPSSVVVGQQNRQSQWRAVVWKP